MSGTRGLVAHRLGPVDQVPVGEGREFQVGAHLVAVFRLRGGAVAATQARCPHRGGPLADGIVGMASVVCPLHGRRFSLADGAEASGDCGVEVHPVRVDANGDLVVELPASAA